MSPAPAQIALLNTHQEMGLPNGLTLSVLDPYLNVFVELTKNAGDILNRLPFCHDGVGRNHLDSNSDLGLEENELGYGETRRSSIHRVASSGGMAVIVQD
uniref:Uncharacterized protein n=1 Tax=Timema genevievae TaxID=629358 RepID=A0A7R9K8T8_TIMGE|nr:unnamed protein product [Timema genevievae]